MKQGGEEAGLRAQDLLLLLKSLDIGATAATLTSLCVQQSARSSSAAELLCPIDQPCKKASHL